VSVKDPLLEAVTPKTNWYVVLRPFGGEGQQFIRGEVVDTTGWLHLNALQNRRYIAPLPYGAVVPELNYTREDGTMVRVIQSDTSEEKPKAKSRKSQ
jgi:hypothetical protein